MDQKLKTVFLNGKKREKLKRGRYLRHLLKFIMEEGVYEYYISLLMDSRKVKYTGAPTAIDLISISLLEKNPRRTILMKQMQEKYGGLLELYFAWKSYTNKNKISEMTSSPP